MGTNGGEIALGGVGRLAPSAQPVSRDHASRASDMVQSQFRLVNGAVAKLTLKRLHHTLTAWYFDRSTFAGTS